MTGVCPLATTPEPSSSGHPLDQLAQELEGFPWGKRGLRLLNYLRDKGVLGEGDVVHGLPVVDLLKKLCTSDPPPGKLTPASQDKILKILRRFKAQGVLIPRAYIASRSCSAVFWGL